MASEKRSAREWRYHFWFWQWLKDSWEPRRLLCWFGFHLVEWADAPYADYGRCEICYLAFRRPVPPTRGPGDAP